MKRRPLVQYPRLFIRCLEATDDDDINERQYDDLLWSRQLSKRLDEYPSVALLQRRRYWE